MRLLCSDDHEQTESMQINAVQSYAHVFAIASSQFLVKYLLERGVLGLITTYLLFQAVDKLCVIWGETNDAH
eukprot:scaffold361119_cov20-Prasinocladus_malaysianus.AAC.1